MGVERFAVAVPQVTLDGLAEALADRAEVPAGVVRPLGRGERIQVPAAVALFDYPCPREWAERAYGDLHRFTDMPAAATSRPWTSPSCWPRTCAGSSRSLR